MEQLIRSIFHPSDFTEGSRQAFAHALAVALIGDTKLTILHAGAGGDDNWDRFPAVRSTLERWGLLEKGSPRSAVFDKLAMRVKKVDAPSKDPLKGILKYLEDSPTDLIVLATEGRKGLPRWISPSVAESVARSAQTLTLFVPEDGEGFVSPEDGEISLRRILLPVDVHPGPAMAVEFAMRTAYRVGKQPVEITVTHIGRPADRPALELPEGEAWTWSELYREGGVAEEIVAAARETGANLIVMATEGQRGILDALRGSTTEQVLRESPCPLLAVPTKS